MGTNIIYVLYLINVIIALVIILIKPRDVAAIWAWLLVLSRFPVLGLYSTFSFKRGPTDKKKFYLRQSDLKEFENFQDFKGDTIDSL